MLYEFQEIGVDFLMTSGHRYLADEMGLGKTVQAVVAAERLGVRRALVVGPAGVLPNWRHEWAEWGNPGTILGLVSYTKLLQDPQLFDGRDWDVVILDEAHYAKNPSAKRTRAALDVARQCERAWLLSGTPMPNHPGELFPPIRVLWPHVTEALGTRTYDDWFDRFVVWRLRQQGPRRRWKQPIRARNLEQLRPYLQDFMFRRTVRGLALGLPPLRVTLSYLKADAEFADRLEELVPQEKREAPGSVSILRHELGRYKAPLVARQISRELEAREYSKIVVMAHHRDVVTQVADILSEHGVVTFHGGTSEREAVTEAFQLDPSVRVFVGQQDAAGVGLNLQVASEIVLLEPAWGPGDNEQAIRRVRRIGSEHPVRARIFAVEDSLDEALMKVIVRKAEGQAELGL